MTKKTLRSVSNQLSFVCKGKGRKAPAYLKADKVQVYIKKKPKRGTRRCLDFSQLDLVTKQEAEAQSTDSPKSGANCVSLSNQKEKSGLYKNGEWNSDGGRQFNSFIYLPFPVKAVTNWRVNVQFTNTVSDVEVWAVGFFLGACKTLDPFVAEVKSIKLVKTGYCI